MRQQLLASRMSTTRTERLLVDWANLCDPPDARVFEERLVKRYPEIFGPPATLSQDLFLMVLGVRTYLRAAWEAPDDRHRGWYIFKLREAYGQFAQAVALPSPSIVTWGYDVPVKLKREVHKRIRGIRGHFESGSLALATTVRPSTDLDVWRAPCGTSGLVVFQDDHFLDFWVRTWSVQRPEEPPPQTAFEQAAFYLYRVATRARVCNSSDCPAPYFLSVKKGQKYCSTKCSGLGEREAKRRWWHENKDRLRPRP
jgi:hypothetical protein